MTPVDPDPKTTVLVANDQEWSARAFETILVGEGHQVVRAYTGRQALARIESHRFDAVILDTQLPDLDGTSVCRMMRLDPRIGATTPIVMTTAGPSGRQERLTAYRAGAWEFYGHPLDPEIVLLKLRLFLSAKLAVDVIREEGLLDEATGLYNRRGLMRRGSELAAQAARHNRHLSCVLLKPSSRAVEEAAGLANILARTIGGMLRETGRLSDVIGRLGPLQFAVLTTSAVGGVERLATRVRELGAGIEGLELVVEIRPWPPVATGQPIETLTGGDFLAPPEGSSSVRSLYS